MELSQIIIISLVNGQKTSKNCNTASNTGNSDPHHLNLVGGFNPSEKY